MKTIKLTGAALEAAHKVTVINSEHLKEKLRLFKEAEAKLAAACRVCDEEIKVQLAIIQEQTGVELSVDGNAQLDVRYLPLGLAFVNIDDGKESVEVIEATQALS